MLHSLIYTVFISQKEKKKKFEKPKWKSSIKLLENNIGENLDDLGYGDDFLDTTPKTLSMKERIGKLDFIKMKKKCSVKENVKRMKRLATDW